MNPKFSRAVTEKLRKPITKKVPVSESTDKKDTKDLSDDKNNGKSPEQPTVPTIGDEDLEFMEHDDGQPSGSLIDTNLNKAIEEKSTSLYCDATIKHIKFPLIVDSGSAGSIMFLNLLKDLDMEITQASRTVMINVNGERRRPLGAVSDIPLEIAGQIIPFDAIITESNSYSAIVGNDWLRKTKANINYKDNTMTIYWNNKVITVKIESQQLPHHEISIEVPEIQKDKQIVEEEIVESDDEEEYEEEFDFNESLFCYAEEEALKIEQEIHKQVYTEFNAELYYNEPELKPKDKPKELDKEKYNMGELEPQNKQIFLEFMKGYDDLFVWEPYKFGRTKAITHTISVDTTPIKQNFYCTSYKN